DLDMLKEVEIIDKSRSAGSIIKVGSTIEVSKDGKKFKFFIVGSNEANPAEGFISNESPLGSAFLGKKKGDVVLVHLPNGKKAEYKILLAE
ncbi:MAG: GreA/GreB family elongation factor, partial [Patescibacteria group bacterium]|nr:GreA/GreB family elongation factor [Patescibacteria group bacterium]